MGGGGEGGNLALCGDMGTERKGKGANARLQRIGIRTLRAFIRLKSWRNSGLLN